MMHLTLLPNWLKKETIFKKPVSPSIIFWIIKNNIVHILRVPREEYDWHNFFKNHQNYEYNYPN